ncbi:MAG: hypothetical protein ACFFDN_02690 [Candidatus Hodarchaeota archaeon]
MIAVIGMPIFLFQTKALWYMESPNAQSWNATLNTSSTFGIDIIPLLIIIIFTLIFVCFYATKMGFG